MRSGINIALGTGIVSVDEGEFYTLEVPEEPPLLSIASGLTTAELPATALARAIEFGKHIEVVLMNDVLEQHPFHLHSHVAWVVGSGHASAEDVYNNNLPPPKLEGAMVRDVYTVPPCTIDENSLCTDVGYVVIRFQADNPGVWMMHCHIEWHMSVGMGMIFVEGEKELREKGPGAFSKSLLSVCAKKSEDDGSDQDTDASGSSANGSNAPDQDKSYQSTGDTEAESNYLDDEKEDGGHDTSEKSRGHNKCE